MYDQHEYLAMVAEFQEAFEASEDASLWRKLIEEETRELGEALDNLLKEFCDLQYVIAGYENVTGEAPDNDPENTLGSHRYNLIANMLMLVSQEEIDACFLEVHRSNMSKLGEDGKPIRREDGKILKGPNYSPADIQKVLREYD